MIIQLKGYPITINGTEQGANAPEHYEFIAKLVRWILLNESDWMMVSDSPLNAEDKQAWAEWRQYLRDLGLSNTNGFSETWEILDPPVNHRPKTWVNLTAPVEHAHDGEEPHTH